MYYIKEDNATSKQYSAIQDLKENIIHQLKSKRPCEISKSLFETIKGLEKSIIEIEYTDEYTQNYWEYLQAIIHIKVPKNAKIFVEKEKEKILQAVKKAYGKADLFELTWVNRKLYLVEKIEIDILEKDDTIIEFMHKANTDTLKLAIEDANSFMRDNKYSSALDRVHTFFVGYIREDLKRKDIEYTENETLNQLFKKLYVFYENEKSLDKKIGTILKSMTGAVSSINDLRNKNSLSHPNEEIVNHRDAKLAIEAIHIIVNYLDDLNC